MQVQRGAERSLLAHGLHAGTLPAATRRLQHHLDAAVLLVIEDAVGLRRLLQGQAVGDDHVGLQLAADDARQQFTVELRKSQKTFEVTADTTLHQQLLALKVNVPFSCEEGICGSCETRVLEGTPDHRDMVLSASEQASNQVMMVCVSGCKSERLVLDV